MKFTNYDNFINKIFFKDDKLYIRNYKKFYNNPKKYENKYNNIKNYLNNRYSDSESLLETLYRIFYKLEIRPICKTCGGKLNLYIVNKKKQCFPRFCSISCANKNEEVSNKQKLTCLNKYGSVNNSKKRIETCLEKYGETTPLKACIIKEKILETNIKKYGVDNPAKSSITKEKMKSTCLNKYGVISTLNLDICRSKTNNKKSKLKEYNTKKKNNSFNKSKSEDISYIALKNKYNDIVQQYRSDKYPFNCDFYIPSLDLYIECNYHWTHGNKPFEGTKEDNIKLEQWKLKNTKYYNNAIYTWTDLDIRKRNIAKENKLNYKEFWNIQELNKWIIES